jgi:outer membrane protein OmpA-like peptidoglycan-associated protein
MFMKKILLSVFTACIVMSLSPVWAGTQFHGAEIDDAKWQTSGNRLECRLSQIIPGYGEATFKHRALQAMEFQVSSNDVPRKSTQALIYVNPPAWKRFANRKILGRVPLNTQKESIVVPEDWAYRMAFELREGMEATWSHSDVGDGQDLVIAKVMPLRFEPAWRDFKECSQNLIEYGLSDIQFSSFYFSKGSQILDSNIKKQLSRLAEYISLDPDFQYIQINSHTDSRGVRRINLAVSKTRANLMKKYLIDKGVDPKRFIIVATGEKNPRFNNRTKEGRAKNRRVEIRLIK